MDEVALCDGSANGVVLDLVEGTQLDDGAAGVAIPADAHRAVVVELGDASHVRCALTAQEAATVPAVVPPAQQ